MANIILFILNKTHLNSNCENYESNSGYIMRIVDALRLQQATSDFCNVSQMPSV